MTPASKVWTKDYDHYLSWVIGNGVPFAIEHPLTGMSAEDVRSALFGYWYCEVRHE
jgi:hypothetical protein